MLSTAFSEQAGATLRLAREAAGLSLGAMERRVHFSKSHLSNLERGRRRITPAVVQGYLEALGDDVNRRQLLMALLMAVGGVKSSSAEVLGRTFELALDEPMAVDDWLARLDDHGRDYLTVGIDEMRMRLAADLTQLQLHLDHPVLAAVAARMLTMHGIMTVNEEKRNAASWYRLGARAADRSGDTETRTWARGRSAHALAYEGSDLAVALDLTQQALALSEEPSTGRLHALLALANIRALSGDRVGALAALEDARRVFDAVGSDDQSSDFVVPEWRMESFVSLVLSRLGADKLAVAAQETADRTLPANLIRPAAHIELHRALLLVRTGGKEEGVAYASQALERLPVEQHGALRVLMAEVKSAGQEL